MVTYEKVLEEIFLLSEAEFAKFQARVINEKVLKIAGVRTPALRKLAKKYRCEFDSIFNFPNEYYEIVFLKLQLAAQLDFSEFLTVSDSCVEVISDWALCDCFAPACIASRREEFVPYIKKYLGGGEFSRRFALTTLLHFYVEEEYLPLIFDCISSCRPQDYYVAMGAAWLLAEVLIKFYETGFEFLSSTMCEIIVRNKAISKACDSFRVSAERKNELKALRTR